MPYRLSFRSPKPRHWLWLALIPTLTVCTPDGVPTATSIEARRQHTATTSSGTPGAVTDLTASSVGSTSVTLSFTQVDDGTGQPANYDVRFAAGSITWWQAASVTEGTCSTPVAGTAIGATLTCTVLGLSPSTTYSFQLVAFRDTLNHNAVFGALSNVVSATTTAAGTPATVTDLSASVTGPNSVALSFTQVDDGTGQPANYDVRSAAGSITWWQAASVTQGTCSTPVGGTAIGAKLTCTVLGLSPSTAYSFQLVAFRDTLNHNATFGKLSNIVGATTAAPAPPSATQLAITTEPSSTAQSGVAFAQQPMIQLRDVSNNAVSQSGVVVTAAIGSGSGGTLGGTTTATTNASGIAQFTNLSLTGAGNYTLLFTASGLTSATSSTISVAARATQLSITTQPSSIAQSGVTFAQQPAIQLRDTSNNPVSQSGVVVAAAIGSGSGTLGGTTTATTNASGIAQFTNLSLTGSGNYTLVFTSSSLTSATSGTISVSAASTGSAILTGISRSAGSTAGGVVVQLTGTGFAAGDAVTFGGTPASGVTLLNASTLQATVPPGSPGSVNVTVVHNGVGATLTNGFTYWPAPTTTYAAADFEGGSIPSPFSNEGASVSTAQAHRGTYSALCQANSSSGIAGVTYNAPQSVMINGDFYVRFYFLVPAATLRSTANNGQIKFYLSRQTTGSGQPGYLMLGEGSEFNSNNNSFASRIDYGVIVVATGPVITPGVWHEVEVYQHRDATTSLGTSRVWYDGQLQGAATSANMGSNDASAVYWTRIGIAYTQNAASYPVQVYVDDVVIANGFVDPTP